MNLKHHNPTDAVEIVSNIFKTGTVTTPTANVVLARDVMLWAMPFTVVNGYYITNPVIAQAGMVLDSIVYEEFSWDGVNRRYVDWGIIVYMHGRPHVFAARSLTANANAWSSGWDGSTATAAYLTAYFMCRYPLGAGSWGPCQVQVGKREGVLPPLEGETAPTEEPPALNPGGSKPWFPWDPLGILKNRGKLKLLLKENPVLGDELKRAINTLATSINEPSKVAVDRIGPAAQ